ncbi:hypothetical protein PM10SUCC1_26580 [Propionigenium maris DSM 9537]|uniref:N-acetyltransferase domain-containing protein n=1 Tax=Propionigenium maris DSM 9537 TaxID=1123000 RepID=A0A9W6GL73_9FUSO|nr:GNAT family N-acetyltransferase [Propionigenium maris]GLI57144.1 hypothetical protein PM10SUCC1_26580 [Propionigenium maris DSM 9537]
MKKLTTKGILDKIHHLEAFEAISQSGGFKIKIDSYVPYIGTAIHAGSALRKELNYKINLSGFHRWQEEDPCTDEFIKELPITVVALDSRYEYDLNRGKNSCIYDEAWGKKVWREKLDPSEIKDSLAKHDEFYEVISFLIRRLEYLFPEVFIFDLHSYNYRRDGVNHEAPLFNLGTHFVKDSFRDRSNAFLEEIVKLDIDTVDNLSGENIVFYGRGYLAEFVNTHFCRTVVFPLEVKKVYCNENNGIYYKAIIQAIGNAVHQAISSFIRKNTDNISYHTLNNFSDSTEAEADEIVAERIAELMQRNYRESNRGEYTSCEIDHLTSNKTPEVMLERIKESFLIYTRRRDEVVGCGILIRKDDRVEAKMLNVDPTIQGMGVAKKICSIREDFARREGYNHLYIESLKYENTINFHSRRGFYPIQSPRKLKYSIYMRKDL